MRLEGKLTLVVLTTLVVGCSLVNDFSKFEFVEDGSVPWTYEAFVDELSARVSDRARRCEGKVSAAADHEMACAHVPGSDADSLFELFLHDFAPQGEARFEATMARACVDAVHTSRCDPSIMPRECAFLRAGTAQVGAICAADSDCASGRCDGAPLSCIDRSCAPLGQPAEACNDDWDCAEPLRCIANVCTNQKAEGASCAANAECEPGLWCDGTQARCRALPDEEGELCAIQDGLDPCAGNLLCIGGACARGVEAGGTCDDVALLCAPGTRCVAGTCLVIGERGDACVSRNDCPKFFDCLQDRCVPRPVTGESCDVARTCAVGACDAGTCRLPATGRSCAIAELDFLPVCEAVCDTSFDPDRCVSKKVDDSGCATDDECASGFCVGTGARTCADCGL